MVANKSWDGVERRRYPRLSEEIPISYTPSSPQTWAVLESELRERLERLSRAGSDYTSTITRHSVSSIITNYSPLGLCIRTAAPIRVGMIVQLELNFQEFEEKLEGLARVVWCKPMFLNCMLSENAKEIPDSCLIGVEFIATNNGIASFMLQNVAQGLIKSYEIKY